MREFEETLPEKSLWRLIAVDRKWGYQFSKGAVPFELQSRKEVNYDNALRVAGGYVRFFKRVLSKFNADVVLFRLGTHSMASPILEHVCKRKNILHLAPTETRVQNYCTITTNKEVIFHNINETYTKIIKGELVIDPSPGEKCYEEMFALLKDKNKTYYHDQGDKYVKKLKSYKPGNVILSFLKAIISTTGHLYKIRALELEKGLKSQTMNKNSRYSFRNILFNYYRSLYRFYQRKKLSEESFYDKYNPSEKYLYFPLHLSPEYALQVRANMWINQLFIIEVLAKSIPFDWKIYVKEHPSNLLHRVRPFSFYKEIKSYANVKLIPTTLDNNDIIRNSQFVVTITGTTGWEAVLFHNKPVINFHESSYEITELSKRVSSLFDLSKEIYNEVKRINKISPDERKKRLVCLLNAVLLHSFKADKPYAVSGEDPFPLSNEDINSAGKTLSNAIKRYIDEVNQDRIR